MRHRKKRGRLSRRSSWRKATLKSLAKDLFTYQRIETTMAKAKALRSYAEPMITLAKNNPESISAMRLVFSKLCDKTIVKTLFTEIAPLFKDTPGGYTRIMALGGSRKGDGAQLAIMELTKRTISDEDLLGLSEKKALPKKKKKVTKKEEASEAKAGKEGHSAPEVDIAEKEKRVVEDVRKEKAKMEQKKVSKNSLFKRFRRKSIG